MKGQKPVYDYGTCIYCGNKLQIAHWKPISFSELCRQATWKCTCDDALSIKQEMRVANEAIKKERLLSAIPQ